MSNYIAEKFFDNLDFADRLDKVFDDIVHESGFKVDKELFRGTIYQDDKLGSIIFRGKYKKKPAVLKIEGLKTEIKELEIINKFNKQNQSKYIRVPQVYAHKNWSNKNRFSYLILEYIKGENIYKNPLASAKDINKFVDFYKNLKTKAIIKPLFKKTADEKSVLEYTARRTFKWVEIAQAQKTLSVQKEKMIQVFVEKITTVLPESKMEFTHGHLSGSDVFEERSGHYVLMSNLYWSYRPQYYDMVFNLWWGIKNLKTPKYGSQELISYIERWKAVYKKLPFIKNDDNFNKLFNMMMMERCVGAVLVDIENQKYKKNEKEQKKYLTNLFIGIFNYYKKLI